MPPIPLRHEKEIMSKKSQDCILQHVAARAAGTGDESELQRKDMYDKRAKQDDIRTVARFSFERLITPLAVN